MTFPESYKPEDIKMCLRAMAELMEILGSYRDSIVVVGGWTPYFLERQRQLATCEHIGSCDIDLLIDPLVAESEEYNTILELLERASYRQRIDKKGNPIPFSFEKTFLTTEGKTHPVQLDLLTASEISATKNKRHREIQPDLRARKVLGAEIALKQYFYYELTETLQGGFETKVVIRVADPVAAIVMKGFALYNRLEGKDAYDIYTLISAFDHPKDVAHLFTDLLQDEIVLTSLKYIREKFRHENDSGPGRAARFIGYSDESERISLQTRIFIIVDTFLRELSL